MEPDFWHQRWQAKEIAFHEQSGNALLVKWFSELSLARGQRIFVPLCGKTRDIAWLLAQGMRVVGAELSEVAVLELFEDLGEEPQVSDLEKFRVYSCPDLEVFVGDLFDLSPAMLGSIDATYDRAALVAMPAELRAPYAERLVEITSRAPQLLISFEYVQSLMAGPPFSVDAAEISSCYAKYYELKLLDDVEVAGGLKGKCPAQERVWRLK